MATNTNAIICICCVFLGIDFMNRLLNMTEKPEEFLAVTVATEETDGYRQYIFSVQQNGINQKTFGLRDTWKGGKMDNIGGGHKINILKENLVNYTGRTDIIIMYTDSYDVVFTSTANLILEKFRKFDANVIFAGEKVCWPDRNLATQYPEVKPDESKFLNAGGFIGIAKDILEIINYKRIDNEQDDQLFMTNIFLDRDLRDKWKIKIDTKSEIFQCLFGALDDVTIKSDGNHSVLYNVQTGSTPLVIHGNGLSKTNLNSMVNYLFGRTPGGECLSCMRNTISLRKLKDDNHPTVQLSIFVDHPTPFFAEALHNLANQNYPKRRMNLVVHNQVPYHKEDIARFVLNFTDKYKSVIVVNPEENINSSARRRDLEFERCLKTDCQYLFSVDGNVQLTEPNTLRMLIQQNRSVIAPMIVVPHTIWSNFWGAVNVNGFYSRSSDYKDIVLYNKMGLWNVPYINNVYLIHGSLMTKLQQIFTCVKYGDTDPDMCFAEYLRSLGIFMFVTNMRYFGHLEQYDDFDKFLLFRGSDNLDAYQFLNSSEPFFNNSNEDLYVDLQLSIFIDQPTPFLSVALRNMAAQRYPKKKMHLFVYVQTFYHKSLVQSFVSVYGDRYKSVKVINPEDRTDTVHARNLAIIHCMEIECQYLFFVDGYVHLTDVNSIKMLIASNKTVIAPMVIQHNKNISNFLENVNGNGFYERSSVYNDILEYKKVGIWNVSYISSVYLIHSSVMPNAFNCVEHNPNYFEVCFAEHLRYKNISMHVTNENHFGHLVSFSQMDKERLHADLYQISKNAYNWEKKYIHENYSLYLIGNEVVPQPCTDVFVVPMVTETFCDQLLQEIENNGNWSRDQYKDVRLSSNYENISIVGISLKQIGFEQHWQDLLKKYVIPIQRKLFPGYVRSPSNATISYVIRYRPKEQASLPPHHDPATFTINIALNTAENDFKGGGCRFIRYNCSVTSIQKGWMMIHPGKLTHYHEGLETTSGTRYILASFVDV